jgi:hypothetical protein
LVTYILYRPTGGWFLQEWRVRIHGWCRNDCWQYAARNPEIVGLEHNGSLQKLVTVGVRVKTLLAESKLVVTSGQAINRQSTRTTAAQFPVCKCIANINIGNAAGSGRSLDHIVDIIYDFTGKSYFIQR